MPEDESTSTGDCILVLTNFPDAATANRIARSLVEQRLAACVNILAPAQSVYRWEGKLEEETEVPALIKTTLETFADLEAAIRELHPYETPEVIAVPILAGSQAYLDWVQAEVG